MRSIPLKIIPATQTTAAMPYRELMQAVLYTPPRDAVGAGTMAMMVRHEVANTIANVPAGAPSLVLEEAPYKTLLSALNAFSWGAFSPDLAQFVTDVTTAAEINPNEVRRE